LVEQLRPVPGTIEADMSRTTGGSLPAGQAIASGFAENMGSRPPKGWIAIQA
jgi:hypothetical protein